jgi:hypothetical protein
LKEGAVQSTVIEVEVADYSVGLFILAGTEAAISDVEALGPSPARLRALTSIV